MDLTQVSLGVGLLAISGLTFVGPSALDTQVVSALTAVALIAGICVALASVARDALLSS